MIKNIGVCNTHAGPIDSRVNSIMLHVTIFLNDCVLHCHNYSFIINTDHDIYYVSKINNYTTT